jgi:hypothetical protein
MSKSGGFGAGNVMSGGKAAAGGGRATGMQTGAAQTKEQIIKGGITSLHHGLIAKLKAASVINKEIKDTLFKNFPAGVVGKSHVQRIEGTLGQTDGLPSGQQLEVQKLMGGLGVLYIKQRASVDSGQLGGRSVEKGDTVPLTAESMALSINELGARLGWNGKATTQTEGVVDTSEIRDRAGKSLGFGDNLAILFAAVPIDGHDVSYEASYTTVELKYKEETRGERMRVDQGPLKATWAEKTFYASLVGVLIAETLKDFTEKERKEARAATTRALQPYIGVQLQSLRMSEYYTMKENFAAIIKVFEGTSQAKDVHAADKQVVQQALLWVFLAMKDHTAVHEQNTVMGTPTEALSGLFDTLVNEATATTEQINACSMMLLDALTGAAGYEEERTFAGPQRLSGTITRRAGESGDEGSDARQAADDGGLHSGDEAEATGDTSGDDDEAGSETGSRFSGRSSARATEDGGRRVSSLTPLAKRLRYNAEEDEKKKKRGRGGPQGRVGGMEEEAQRRAAIADILPFPNAQFDKAIRQDQDFMNTLRALYAQIGPHPGTGETRGWTETAYNLAITLWPGILRKMAEHSQAFFTAVPFAQITARAGARQGHDAQHHQGGGRGAQQQQGGGGHRQQRQQGGYNQQQGGYNQQQQGGYNQQQRNNYQQTGQGGFINAVEMPPAIGGRPAGGAQTPAGRGSGLPARGYQGRGGRGGAGRGSYNQQNAGRFSPNYYGPQTGVPGAQGGRGATGGQTAQRPAPTPAWLQQQQQQQAQRQPQQQTGALQSAARWQQQQTQQQQYQQQQYQQQQYQGMPPPPPRQQQGGARVVDFSAQGLWVVEAKEPRGVQGEIMAIGRGKVRGPPRFVQRTAPGGGQTYTLTSEEGAAKPEGNTELGFLQKQSPTCVLWILRNDRSMMPVVTMIDGGAGTCVVTPAGIRMLAANGVKMTSITLEQPVTFGGLTGSMSYPPVKRMMRFIIHHGDIGVDVEFAVMGADTDPPRIVVGSWFSEPAGQKTDCAEKSLEWTIGGRVEKYVYQLEDPTVLDPGDATILRAYMMKFGKGRETPDLRAIAEMRRTAGWWAAK